MSTSRRAGLVLVVAAVISVTLATPAAADLVSYWPMNLEATGPIGTSGTFSGTVASVADRNGQAGGALAFAATSATTGSYANIPGGGGLDGLASGTVSMWVRYDTSPQDGSGGYGFSAAVLARQSNGQFSNDVLGLNGAGPATARFRWRGSDANGDGLTSPGVGAWHHVAVTFTPGAHLLYVDGNLEGTIANAASMNSNAAIPLTIGAWIGDGACYSTATVDDVAVWNTVLTPAQVSALAGSSSGPLGPAIRPVGARASSELIAGHNRRVGNITDGLGRNTTSTNDWAGNPGGMWLSNNGDATGWVNFDTGGLHQLDWMSVHNYNEVGAFTNRGVQQAEVLVSADNVNWTSLGVQTLAKATGDSTNPGQLISLGGVQARYVRLDILSNYGDSGYTGLNEVDFYGKPLGRMPIPGVTAAASSSLYESSFDRRGLHLVDATGLYAGTHYNVPDGTMWLSTGVGFGNPGDDGNPQVVFDLQRNYELLDSMRVWNYNETGAFTNRGVRDMNVLVSQDGVNFELLGTYTLNKAPGTVAGDFSQLLDLDARNVRYVMFDILSNWNNVSYPTATGNSGNDFAFVGLSEVQFLGTAVPEPATLALLCLGAAGLRSYLRRRRTS